MEIKGNGFRYFIDEKEVLYKDLQTMIRLDMTVEIEGLNVYYSSPKKVKDRLLLAEKFKKKALDEIYFKNPNFKKEQEDNKFSKLNHNEVREEFINRARTEKMNRLVEEELERQELKTMKYKSPFANIRGNFYKGSDILIKDDFLDLLEAKKFFNKGNFDAYFAYNKDGVLIGSESNKENWAGFMPGFGFCFPRRGKIINYSKETPEVKDKTTEKLKPSGILGVEDAAKIMTKGKKENNGKIDYSEIDFDILDLMANRFNANKHKYPQGNMLKPIEEKQLLFALLRHLKKMIQPVDNDPETFEEHLSAILCNAQMVYQQRKLNKN